MRRVFVMNEYGVDLARIHHEGHGDLTRNAGRFIVGQLRNARIRGGLVVDLGCGSGILARHLLESGFDVLGVDPSAAMVQIARRVAPAARFVRKRAEHTALPRCVAVIAAGEALTYVDARVEPIAHLRRHIRRVARALERGGLLIFDVIVADPARPMMYRTWRTGPDWAVLTDVSEDVRRRVVCRNITAFTRAGSTYRRSNTEHHVAVYARDAVLTDLRAEGFTARTLRGYGPVPLGPRRRVFRARLLRST
jgi:SAM-dependent methyltransferase